MAAVRCRCQEIQGHLIRIENLIGLIRVRNIFSIVAENQEWLWKAMKGIFVLTF